MSIRVKVVLSGRDPLFLELPTTSKLESIRKLAAKERSIPLDHLAFGGDLAGCAHETLKALNFTNNQPVFLDVVKASNKDLIAQQLRETEYEDHTEEHLLINIKVNGTDAMGCIDTGAQTTMLSFALAQRLGLESVIDRRCAGKVIGVGTSSTVGTIHQCPLKVGSRVYGASVSVIESFGGDVNFDVLIGCNFMKKNRWTIDLDKYEVRIQDEVVPIGRSAIEEGCIKLIELFQCKYSVAKSALCRTGGNIEAAASIIIGV